MTKFKIAHSNIGFNLMENFVKNMKEFRENVETIMRFSDKNVLVP